jgi:YD repeat-containing protein
VVIIFFIFFSRGAHCQLNSADIMEKQYFMPSPQTSDFMKYGNVPIGHYTGNLDLQIPIYNYKDNDFNLNLSFGYNSSGFIANKSSGIAGLNWYLNAGGVITRNIVGAPDDQMGNPTSLNDPPFVHGLWYGLKRDVNAYENSQIFNFSEGAGVEEPIHIDWVLGSPSTNYYETTSDIYNFNFTGHSGKFIIGYDKKAHVYGTEAANTFDIDLTGMSDQNHFAFFPNPSTITVKTGDGYKYIFGGNTTYLEYKMNVNINAEPFLPNSWNPVIVSWYLKEIVSPNGRTVTFDYLPFNEVPHTPFDQNHYILNIYPKSYSEYYSAYNSYFPTVFQDVKGYYTDEDPTYEVLKTVYLSYIIVDNGSKISFHYSENEKSFYQSLSSVSPLFYEQKGLKLDSIDITYNDNLIKKALFSTSYKGSLQKERLFLDEVEIKGEKPYVFEYYTGNFPSPVTRGMDYWGFWNGVDDNYANLIPSISDPGELGDIQYTSNEREPNTNAGIFNLGLLQKVTYPTGGYTSIEYEPHKYLKKLDRRSDNNFLPKLYDVTESSAGGARVKKLTDFDGQNQSNIREYIYKKNYNPLIPESGASSGILLNWPRYYYSFSSDYVPGHGSVDVVRLNNLGISINATENEYISYPYVVEKRSDNSYTEFQYSNYNTNPDNNIHNEHNSSLSGHTIVPYNFYVNIYRIANCKSFERGRLIRKSLYSSDGSPVSKEFFNYNRWGDENYISSILLSGDRYFSRKDYTYQYVLNYDTLLTYTMNGSSFIQIITNYTYNNYGLIASKSFGQSNGSNMSSHYFYPTDVLFDAYGGALNDCDAYCSNLGNQYYSCKSNCEIVCNGVPSCIESCIINNCASIIPQQCGSCFNYPFFNNSACHSYCEEAYLNGLSTQAKTIKTMIGKNILTPPIQVLEKKDGNITGGSYATYEELLSGAIVPEKVYNIETTVPLASFADPYVNNGGALIITEKYKEKVYYNSYDNLGNLLEYHKKDDISVSYIWGYNQIHPVIKAENVGYTTLNSAVTSVESDLQGFLRNTIVDLTSDTQKNAWKSFNIALRNALPATAMVTTYTYNPLIGMTSATDENNVTTYYEYDSFGRLKYLKDKDGNILKQHNYHYMNQ